MSADIPDYVSDEKPSRQAFAQNFLQTGEVLRCWLWHVKAYTSFDVGYRVEGFTEFDNEKQFAGIAEDLSHRAAAEVSKYRELFPNVGAVARYYIGERRTGIWPNYHSAIACALTGLTDKAHHYFSHVLKESDDAEWAMAAKADAINLDTLAADVDAFRKCVADRVQDTRMLMKLSSVIINFAEPPPEHRESG